MDILFYDTKTPVPYQLSTLREHGLGGTEATVIRIAHSLAQFHTVYIAQTGREIDYEEENVRYISFDTAAKLKPNAVILLRDYQLVAKIAADYPSAKLFFWVHNTPSNQFFKLKPILLKTGYQIIVVSHYHRRLVEKKLKGKPGARLCEAAKRLAAAIQRNFARLFLDCRALQKTCRARKDGRLSKTHVPVPIQVIYNPIADTLSPDNTPIQPNKLLFLSSPHKGLKETLTIFKQVQKHFPHFHLAISNPGYREMTYALSEQVNFLGVLRHEDVIQQLRESFCVFYPQYVKPETFGLIYAEANAVGTPVLAHHFGAAEEILSTSNQLINGHKIDQIIAKLTEWQKQRPKVAGKSAFRLTNVTHQWLQVLEKIE